MDSDGSPPYPFIVTPLLVFLLVGLIASFIQIRRRKRLQRMGMWPQPHHGGPTRRIGPDGTWVPGIVRRDGSPTRPSHVGRGGSGNVGGQAGPRSQEGLNELGEAPPPYDPNAKKDVELSQLERGGAEPPGYGALGGPPNTNPYTSPAGSPAEGLGVRPPAPAVTR